MHWHENSKSEALTNAKRNQRREANIDEPSIQCPKNSVSPVPPLNARTPFRKTRRSNIVYHVVSWWTTRCLVVSLDHSNRDLLSERYRQRP
ncbi:uncharacterized protein LOC143214285 [Lasioglossum baleicum]|uniref:uncharacterized protein LOC143214285 n=1 Tax=Lasioglossum baleicum TaxID=434251 RepID=UPI003FCE5F1F